jgi:hypothetical protein
MITRCEPRARSCVLGVSLGLVSESWQKPTMRFLSSQTDCLGFMARGRSAFRPQSMVGELGAQYLALVVENQHWRGTQRQSL